MRSSKPIIIFSLIVSGLLLSACGQKGPLFIPEDELAKNRAEQMERAKEAHTTDMKEAGEAPGNEVDVIDESPKQDKDSAEKKKALTTE